MLIETDGVCQHKFIMISCYKLTAMTTLSSPWNLGMYLSPLTTSELFKGRKRHMTLMVHSAGSAIFSCEEDEEDDDGERSSRSDSSVRLVCLGEWLTDGFWMEGVKLLSHPLTTHTHKYWNKQGLVTLGSCHKGYFLVIQPLRRIKMQQPGFTFLKKYFKVSEQNSQKKKERKKF